MFSKAQIMGLWNMNKLFSTSFYDFPIVVFYVCMCVCLYCISQYVFSYRTEKDKAPPSPQLTIYSNGLVSVQNDQILVSTCRMHVYKFPFDIQSCNLSFKSVVHSGECNMLCFLCPCSLFEHSRQHIILEFLSSSTCKETSRFLNFFFISHTSQGNTARSLSQLLRGHAHDDADPVRVAVHQHDSQQQNCLHVSPQTRRDYLHCKYAVKTNFSTVEMLLLA